MLLAGRVILITGAGQGLGRGIAQAVLEEGARVAMTDVRMEDAARSAQALSAEAADAAARIVPLALDVTDAGAIRRAMQTTVETFERLDGLVNNAGVITMGSAADTTPEEWSRHFAVN